ALLTSAEGVNPQNPSRGKPAVTAVQHASGFTTRLVSAADTYAYAPSIIYENGVYHAFFCSNSGEVPYWDAIRHISSSDGFTWSSPPDVVLRGSAPAALKT